MSQPAISLLPLIPAYSSGGRIKFNLDDLNLEKAYQAKRFLDPFEITENMTNWELQQVLNVKQFYDSTDFFIGGRKLTPEEVLGFELYYRGGP